MIFSCWELLMRIFLCLTFFCLVFALCSQPATADDALIPTAGHASDGKPINFSVSGLNKAPPGLKTEIVSAIMQHAGLPQNFTLYTDPEVANAAAVILVDKEGRGRRALVCNENFLETAQQASAERNWAPVGIIAHEIGHHLAGHSLIAGDWQPRSKLAADAFSGFILYKLGAKLDEVNRTVITPVEKQENNPSRDQRLAAVRQGWLLACRQQSGTCDSEGSAPLLPTPTAIDQGAAKALPGKTETAVTPAPAAVGPADLLPFPDWQAIPIKFGRFVIDELGVLDRAARAAFERRMFDLTPKNQVEIVTIVSKDLHGLTADEYAQAMLRQLAVGSKEVASGAVLLVAPHEKQVGMALAPGLLTALGDKAATAREQLKNFQEFSLITCQGNCPVEQTAMLFHAASFIADTLSNWDFSVLYPKNGAIPAGNVATGTLRLRGKIIGRDATPQLMPPAAPAKVRETTLKIADETGREALLSLYPEAEKLALVPLTTGKSYQFIVRELPPTEQMRHFEVLNYAELP
ncbi:MAG TPA: hypothetical protein DEB25_02910 [Desulfobulbaceae bacterium]|nr:hypothetical protein [Desulfobulbaceae bacterium]